MCESSSDRAESGTALPAKTATVAEAARWFPYPPILSFQPRIDRLGGREFAEFWSKGADGDPRNGAYLYVFWQPRPADYDYFTEVERGSIFLDVRLIGSTDDVARTPHPDFRNTFKKVAVRGHEALMQETYKDEAEIERRGRQPWRLGGNLDRRQIFWTQDVGEGRTILWWVWTDPLRYSEQEALQAVDEMAEIG